MRETTAILFAYTSKLTNATRNVIYDATTKFLQLMKFRDVTELRLRSKLDTQRSYVSGFCYISVRSLTTLRHQTGE